MKPLPSFTALAPKLLLGAILLLAAGPGLAANKNSPAKPAPTKIPAAKPVKADEGFKDFAIITQRNVFNSNRSATAPNAAPVAAAPKPARAPRVEAFALLGTMVSERGSVAFFDGTSAAYRRAVEPGDQLGSHTVATIDHDRVTLREGDRELCLPLKMQFRREEQNEWQLAALPDDFQPTAPPPGQVFAHSKPDPRSFTPEQVRSYVLSKYDKKLTQLADQPEKADKLMKALDKEIEGRIRKLEKDSNKAERKLLQSAP